MAISQNDKFMYPGSPGTATTLSSPGYTTGVDTGITVGTTASFPTLSGCIFAIDTVEVVTTNGVTEEVQVAGTYTVYSGTVTNGTTIGNVTLLYGTAQSYAAGALTRVYIPVSALYFERLIGGLLVSLDQDGTLKAGAVDNAAALATGIVGNINLLTTAGDIGGASEVWAATLTGYSADPANGIYRYTLHGKFCTLFIRQPVSGTSNATTKTITLPFTAATITGMFWMGLCSCIDNNAAAVFGNINIATGGTTAAFIIGALGTGGTWTASGAARVGIGTITYETA